MNRQNLRKADLQLMMIFEALMQERGVSRVAEKLFMAQATVSAALGRLRSYFNDPLFVRIGHRMEPTARAVEIMNHLAPALDSLSLALSLSEGFDPSTSDRVYRIAMSDDVELALMPSIVQTIRNEAPYVKLIVSPIDWSNISERLMDSDFTLAVAPTRQLPPTAKQRVLKRVCGYVLKGKLNSDTLDMDEFCQRPHIQVSPIAEAGGLVDKYLADLDRRRNVVMTVSKYSALSSLLIENPEFLVVLPEYAARRISFLAGLECEPLPFEAPQIDLSMVWLPLQDHDPAERWLRDMVRLSINNDLNMRGASTKKSLVTKMVSVS